MVLVLWEPQLPTLFFLQPLVLDISGGATAVNSSVGVWHSKESAGQFWELVQTSGSQITIEAKVKTRYLQIKQLSIPGHLIIKWISY